MLHRQRDTDNLKQRLVRMTRDRLTWLNDRLWLGVGKVYSSGAYNNLQRQRETTVMCTIVHSRNAGRVVCLPTQDANSSRSCRIRLCRSCATCVGM